MTTANYQQKWRDGIRMEEEFLKTSDDEISSNMDQSDNDYDQIDQNINNVSGNESDISILDEDEAASSADCQSSSEDEMNFAFNDYPPFSEQLRKWAVKNDCRRGGVTELLKILHLNGHDDLPKDSRTLLKTPREVAVEEKCGGSYIYLGIKRGISRCLEDNPNYNSPTIKLIVNADGIPLFKSTALDLWPILGMFVYPRPFVISLFTGQGKPDSPEEFLEDFLNEYRDLKENGFFTEDNRHFSVVLWCMTCDAPARQFLKCIKGHGGYFACERCTIKGQRVENRTVFLSTDEPRRTDRSFDNFEYEGDHQHFPSPLIGSGIKCVEDFALDYMHLVCLGVMKRLLQYLKEGPRTCRLSQGQLTRISQLLQNYRGKMPSEFARQPRGLDHLSRFKATEFRSFLLYYGCVVLRDILPQPAYKHFLSLVTALRILLDENDDHRNHHLNFAKELLEFFSDNASIYYTETFTVYNVHSLIHLPDDARRFNVCLDKVSCFPFENHLQILKKLIRNATNPLVSTVKRIAEIESAGKKSSYKCILTKVSKIPRDSWFLLENEDVVCVKEIQSSTSFLCKVYKKNELTDYFVHPPCQSSTVGIFFLSNVKMNNNKDERHTINKTSMKRKIVCLAVETGNVLISLLNDVKFDEGLGAYF
ncbi:uncharacterized protein [Clytia hemisphaerica]